MSFPEPTMQVSAIETTIGKFASERVTMLRISTHAGESVARFEDLPPDVRQALADWVGSCGLPCGPR